MVIPGIIKQIWATIVYYIRGIVRSFLENDNVFIWCGAIAFKGLVTFLPLSFLALGLFGLFLQREDLASGLASVINTFLPTYQSQEILSVINAFAESSNTITVIGALGSFIAAITLFTTLRMVIGNVFGAQHTRRSMLHGYASDLRMTILCGILFLLTIGITILFRYVKQAGEQIISNMDASETWVEQGWLQMISSTGVIVPLLISTTLFFLLFYFTPIPRPRLSSALIGGSVTGILWEVAKNAFTFYATQLGIIERYSYMTTGEGSVSAFGSVFGLIVALVFWVYYSGVVLIIGAIVTALREERIEHAETLIKTLEPEVRTEPIAVPVVEETVEETTA